MVIVGRGDYFNAMVDNAEAGKRNTGLSYRIKNLYMGIGEM